MVQFVVVAFERVDICDEAFAVGAFFGDVEMAAHGVDGGTICLVELVFLTEGHMAGLVPALLQGLELGKGGFFVRGLFDQCR